MILKKGETAPYSGFLTSDPAYRFYQTEVKNSFACESKLLRATPQDCVNKISWSAFFGGVALGFIFESVIRSVGR